MSKIDAALAAARRGFRVFPIAENAKKPPMFGEWQEYATTKEQTIRNWWNTWPEANIGIYTHDLLVVDIDPRNGGKESFQLLQMTEDFPSTTYSQTAGGGNHIFYKLPPGRTASGKADRVAKGVDAKASGGYVVAPGSTIDGRAYQWGNDNEPGLAPEWLIDRCQKVGQRSESAGKVLVEDTPNNLEDCNTYIVGRAPEADEGGRDDTAVAVANVLYDIGVSVDTCREFLCEWSDKKCNPPLDFEALERIAASARKSRDKAIGCMSRDLVVFETYEIDESRKPTSLLKGEVSQETDAGIPATENRKLFYLPFRESVAYATAHASNPLVKGLIDCGSMSVVYGESNSGKSFTESDKDFHIAAGLPWSGLNVKQGAVLYIAAEGGAGIHKRMAAMAQHYGKEDVPLYVVPCPVNLLRSDADVKPLIQMAKEIEAAHGQPIVKVTIDTLSRAIAGGEENSSVDMGSLVRNFDAIRGALACHLAVIHHTGKDKAKGARGHSLLRAATDTEIEIVDGKIKVTKQRDMDGSVEMRFKLKVVRVGVDPQGEPVDSCYVVLGRKGDPEFAIELSGAESDLLEAIKSHIEETCHEGHFSNDFVMKAGVDIGVDKSTLRTQLSTLVQKDAIKKLEKNQYVINLSRAV